MTRLHAMASLHRRHILLATLIIFLMGVAVWRNVSPPMFPELPVVTVAGLGQMPPSAQASALPPLSELSAAAVRPLFNPNRKRAEAVPVATPQSAAPVRPFRTPVLLGIAGVGERRVALIKLPDDKEARRIRSGDSIEGWTVGEIANDAVTFRNGGVEHEVRLRSSKDSSSGATVRR